MKQLAPQQTRTFFVSSATFNRIPLFREQARAGLFMDVLQKSRQYFLLHAFVLMPDHFHILFTPNAEVSLEKAVQYLKGGFSFRVKRELAYQGEIWQRSFNEHRIVDASDFHRHREYIERNPIKAGFGTGYPYLLRDSLDPMPAWLGRAAGGRA